jgi:hypothetical protein
VVCVCVCFHTALQFIIGAAEKHSQYPLSEKFLTVTLNETAGNFFAAPRCAVIRDSSTPKATYGTFINQSFAPRETVARRSLTQECEAAPCRWAVDFSEMLAFGGGIDSVEFSFEVAEGFPTAALRPRDDDAVRESNDEKEN